MLRLPGRWGAQAWVVGLLVLAVSVPLDAPLHDLVFRHVVSHEVRLLANGVTHLGTAWAAVGVLGGLAVLARRAADTQLWRVSLAGLGGVALASLASQAVKQVACRGRPTLVDGWGVDTDGVRGPVPWQPLVGGDTGFFHWPCLADSRHRSFPSGHATTAFALAAALARAAPARRRLWLLVAGGIGASRISLNAHFLSDVIGGGLLGWWSGQLAQRLADRHAARPESRRSTPGAVPAGTAPGPEGPPA
jgi:membrane-associated phospholipid phosphatase